MESIDGFVNRLMRLYATLADYLEEEGLADDIMMAARYEVLRISKAPLRELIQVLKDYVEIADAIFWDDYRG